MIIIVSLMIINGPDLDQLHGNGGVTPQGGAMERCVAVTVLMSQVYHKDDDSDDTLTSDCCAPCSSKNSTISILLLRAALCRIDSFLAPNFSWMISGFFS